VIYIYIYIYVCVCVCVCVSHVYISGTLQNAQAVYLLFVKQNQCVDCDLGIEFSYVMVSEPKSFQCFKFCHFYAHIMYIE